MNKSVIALLVTFAVVSVFARHYEPKMPLDEGTSNRLARIHAQHVKTVQAISNGTFSVSRERKMSPKVTAAKCAEKAKRATVSADRKEERRAAKQAATSARLRRGIRKTDEVMERCARRLKRDRKQKRGVR